MTRCYIILKEYFDENFGEVMYEICEESFLNLEDAREYLVLDGYKTDEDLEDDGFIEYKKIDGTHDYALVKRVSVY